MLTSYISLHHSDKAPLQFEKKIPQKFKKEGKPKVLLFVTGNAFLLVNVYGLILLVTDQDYR